ncbi:hypothetical protein DB30_01906 [Enhygromyxa salina]|uniref:Uncharacterized protein n=1 Tax=Enhygromyxa salina TaxID=215803 RepID=A0A0C1ZKH3_9BACT|nr:hypothetical protein [Enhygromyxa salina]KIG18019.1 hypothetical protein DB30_01906 [Enhygromyxa salina]
MALLLTASMSACKGDDIADGDGASETGTETETETGDEGEVPDPEQDSERITGIGVGGGPDELTYSGLDSLEEEVWGPAAYVVDHLGLNWLADGPGHKILVIDDDGEIVDRYDLEGLVRGISDIEVTKTHVYVLMVGGQTPIIARAGRNDVDATAWETFDIPAEIDVADITGLRKHGDGGVALELAFGREHLPLFAEDGTSIAAPGAPISTYQVDGHSVALVAATGLPAANLSVASLLVDDVEVATIETAGLLGDFALIGVTPDGDMWLRVADVGILEGAFVTRMLAYRYALDGTLMQAVEMPMRNELVWVEHRMTMDPEGELRVMSTGADEASLRRPVDIGVATPLVFPPGVTPYLPVSNSGATQAGGAGLGNFDPGTGGGLEGDEGQCMSREEIMQRAYAYANFEAVYNAQHMQTCPGRTPVAYFQQHLGQTIRGVAYKYAGHIEVSTYANAVANNYTVGDLNTKTDKAVDGCSYGVDCSGFVSKAWLSGHRTTSSLHTASYGLDSYDALLPGDALNKPGSHVRLVAEHLGGYGVKVIEATVGSERMRVIVRDISWGNAGYAAGYAPVRYNNVCPDLPPPPPETTTHLVFDVSGYLPDGSGYVPVGPARVLDTRIDGQEFVGPLAHDETISVTLAGKAGLPAAAQLGAVVLNVAIADPQGKGFLAAYPDAPYPGNSSINFAAGEATPGLVIVDPGADGKVELHHISPNGGSQVVVDTFGYFPPAADIHMVTPARVFDSRDPEFGATVVAAGTKELQLAGVGGIPLAGVGAVIANLAAITPAGPGYATIYESGTPKPVTSNLNYLAGAVRSNLVIIPVSADGFATLFTLEDADYVVDVLGWFGEGVDFQSISPVRLRDTREDDAGPIGHEGSILVDVIGAATIPEGVTAVFGNLTAAQPTLRGYLQIYPDAVPGTANVNFIGGKVASNAVLTEVSANGAVHIRVVIPPP